MNTDTMLVLGIILAGFAIPSIFSSFSEKKAPRLSVLLLLIAGALIYFAYQWHPDGYSLAEIPNAFVRVAADYIP